MANKNSWAASAASRRKTAVANFWQMVEALFPNKYTYEKFEYLGSTTLSTVTCRQHGDFETKPTYLVNGWGCPVCGREKSAAGAVKRRLGIQGFAEKAKALHGTLYQYPEQPYTSNKTKVEIVCSIHGSFWQKPNTHLDGKGCPECANDGKRKRNNEIAAALAAPKIAALKAAFPKYDFSESVYTGGNKKVKVHCPEHGVFLGHVNNMLCNGAGCPQCGQMLVEAAYVARRTTQEQWLQRAVEIHGDKYDYSVAVYMGDKQHIDVICKKHGLFKTRTDGHIYEANGCPKCSHHLSKGESEIFSLVSNYTTAISRDRTVLAPKELDILLPERRIAIEYCGEFWHSHGSAEEEKKSKLRHYQKYVACKMQGIRLLTVYESEWQEHHYALQRLLRNACGKSKGKLMARKCDLRKVSNAEARAFYERYHPQGGAGFGEHYGLFWKDKLVACMRFSLGTNDRGAGASSRVWTLGRYATRVTVVGAASRLFKAFLAEYKPTEVKSFSDNRYFEGGMYEQLGFQLEADMSPDYQVWSPKVGLRPKPHYQRRQLQKRLEEHGLQEKFDAENDLRTEAEMTYLMGARRIYDCGKKRWAWKLDTPKFQAHNYPIPDNREHQTSRVDAKQTDVPLIA